MSTVTWGCPYCSDFSVDDPGITFDWDVNGTSWTVRATRPAWELTMLQHLKSDHPRELLSMFTEAAVAEAAQRQLDALIGNAFKSITSPRD